MSKKQTPAEKLGFKVGEYYEVVNANDSCVKGSVLKFVEDNGKFICPFEAEGEGLFPLSLEHFVPINKPHPHAQLIKYWAEGYNIEYWNRFSKSWQSQPRPSWDPDVEYRLTPVAPVIPEPPREMTVGEIQKELGFKIKIVEK